MKISKIALLNVIYENYPDNNEKLSQKEGIHFVRRKH